MPTEAKNCTKEPHFLPKIVRCEMTQALKGRKQQRSEIKPKQRRFVHNKVLSPFRSVSEKIQASNSLKFKVFTRLKNVFLWAIKCFSTHKGGA